MMMISIVLAEAVEAPVWEEAAPALQADAMGATVTGNLFQDNLNY